MGRVKSSIYWGFGEPDSVRIFIGFAGSENARQENLTLIISVSSYVFRRSFKYILIAGINALILLALYRLSIDELVRAFNPFSTIEAFLVISGIFFMSLLGMRILVGWLKKKGDTDLRKKKLRYSMFLTLLISVYFYGDYFLRVYDRFFDERREAVMAKIKPAEMLAYGTKAETLTYEEYSLLRQVTGWFPELPFHATNIAYVYSYDGFLPDYQFDLVYEVPLDEAVEIIDFENGSFDQSRTSEVENGRKVVTYSEGRY